MGPSQITLTRLYANVYLNQAKLTLDEIYIGTSMTAADGTQYITDSAAAASAIATGVKTYNGAISVSDEEFARPLATMLEAAKAQGKSIGVITTTSVSHATPAAFLAHVRDRNMESAIVAEYLDSDADIIIGGGERYFVSQGSDAYFGKAAREDNKNYLQLFRNKGYQIVNTKQALEQAQSGKLLALFAANKVPFVIDREESVPNLSESLAKAIELVESNPKGFVLMLEGGRIDHAGHLNDPVGIIHETLEFDQAVDYALQYAKEHPDTSIIATADHESGGMSVGADGIYDVKLDVLNQLKHSTEIIAPLFLSANSDIDIRHLMRENLGITDISEADILAILAAKPQTAPPYQLSIDATTISNQPDEIIPIIRALNQIVSKRALIGWTSTGHTGVDVGLYAYGPMSQLLLGLTDNTDIEAATALSLGLDLAPIRQRLQAKYFYPVHWLEIHEHIYLPLKIIERLDNSAVIDDNAIIIDRNEISFSQLNLHQSHHQAYISINELADALNISLQWDPLSERILILSPPSTPNHKY